MFPECCERATIVARKQPFSAARSPTSILSAGLKRRAASATGRFFGGTPARSMPCRRRITAAVAVPVAISRQLWLHRNVSRRHQSIALAELNGCGRAVMGSALMLGGGGELDGRQGNQRRTGNRQNRLLHFIILPCSAALRSPALRVSRLFTSDNDGQRRLLPSPVSRSSEQILWSKIFSARYSSRTWPPYSALALVRRCLSTTGSRSIALMPGRLRHVTSDSSIASVNSGQRWNSDFSAHLPSIRAS
jgi:hypothetical protein